MAGLLDGILGGGVMQPQPQQDQLPYSLQPTPGGNIGAGLAGFFNSPSLVSAIGNLAGGLITGQRTDPQGIQWQYMRAEYDALKQQFPKMSDAEIFYRMNNPEGMANLFMAKPVPGFKTVAGSEAPGMQLGNTITPPVGMDFQTLGPGAPTAGVQPQPSQQPASSPPSSPMAQLQEKNKLEEKGKLQAQAQQALPDIITESDATQQQIHNLLNHPAIEAATGTFAGRNPFMTGPVKDFASRFDQLRSSALFQTILQSKADAGRAGNAGLTYAASGKLIDPYARALPTADFKKALMELSDRVSAYKKNAWISAGSPKDSEKSANSFSPQPFHYNDFTPGPDWQYSARRNQYRDPQGKIYDQYGNQVRQ